MTDDIEGGIQPRNPIDARSARQRIPGRLIGGELKSPAGFRNVFDADRHTPLTRRDTHDFRPAITCRTGLPVSVRYHDWIGKIEHRPGERGAVLSGEMAIGGRHIVCEQAGARGSARPPWRRRSWPARRRAPRDRHRRARGHRTGHGRRTLPRGPSSASEPRDRPPPFHEGCGPGRGRTNRTPPAPGALMSSRSSRTRRTNRARCSTIISNRPSTVSGTPKSR